MLVVDVYKKAQWEISDDDDAASRARKSESQPFPFVRTCITMAMGNQLAIPSLRFFYYAC